MNRMHFAPALLGGVLALTAAPLVGSAGAAADTGASVWSLQAVGSGRSCSLKLGFTQAGGAGALVIPAGCRHAVPSVRKAAGWSLNAGGQISFNAEGGQSVLSFERQADGTWQATATDGTALMLTPTGRTEAASGADAAALQDKLDDAQSPVAPAAIAQAPAPPTGTVRPGKAGTAKPDMQALAGRYAVMRGDRDTGCMVTLDTERGRDGPRARLAPACRDQGITIFDPVNWSAKGGDLVLTARKGHSINLTRDDNGTWVKMPKDAKALGLKPL